MARLIWIVICLWLHSQVEGKSNLPRKVKIGAIFENGDEMLLRALEKIVEQINHDRYILPGTELSIEHRFVKRKDSFSASKLSCRLLEQQIWAIISSRSDSVTWFARSLAESLQIPHLSINWDYRSLYMVNVNQRNHRDAEDADSFTAHNTIVHSNGIYMDRGPHPCPAASRNQSFTFNYYPESIELGEAFKDFIESRNWKSFTLIYDTDDRLVQMRDLLRVSTTSMNTKVKMTIVKVPDEKSQKELVSDLSPGESLYQKLMKQISIFEHNYVLNVNPEIAIEILHEAKRVGRISEYDNFLFASMDLHTLNLSTFQAMTPTPNITSFSLLSAEAQNSLVSNLPSESHNGWNLAVSRNSHWLTTGEALIQDAVNHFARSLDFIDRSFTESIKPPQVQCNSTRVWPMGVCIVDSMMKTPLEEKTGLLTFDQYGNRVNFSLDVLQLKSSGLKNIAKWTRENGIQSTHTTFHDDSYQQILKDMKYKEFRVTFHTRTKPYIYKKDNASEYTGNARYTGFCVDLLDEIANVFREDFKSDFKYDLREVKGGQFGQRNNEGEWNGMLGELMRHQSDLVIGDLTATYLRETAVDFTMPFMNLGIAILFKNAELPDPELFSFLKPFSDEVWLYLASAFLGISLLLWILSRISPYEWVSPHPCDPDPMELENQFSIGNSLWFTIGSLMQQGSDLGPRALSTRTLASVWWFFTLIMISSYTANLAASITLSRMTPAISNVEDLVKQTAIQYGCKRSGSTHEFFKNSNHTIYQRMYNTMEMNPEVYINDIYDAIERIRKGGYAYLAESSTIEYLVQRNCDLIQVGFWLDNKGYGIATPTDSPYRTPISNAIVVLQDKGILYSLKKKWWEEKGRCTVVSSSKAAVANDLKIEHVGGVFVVLVAGVVLGCLSGALEFIWKSLKIARDERESVGKLIWLEIVRICTGGGSSRPVYGSQGSNNQTTDNGKDNSDTRKLVKSASYNSMNMAYPGSSPDYGQIRYPEGGMSNTDSALPLISPHSIASQTGQINQFTASSPSSFKSQPFTMY